jgi:hypothetical protein
MRRARSIGVLVLALTLLIAPEADAASGSRSSSFPLMRKQPEYRSCVPSEPALALVAELHRVSFRAACRVTRRLVSQAWPESDRVKITRWCWDDLGKVSSFEGWNVKIRGFDGPATLSRGGRWFAFLGQEFPISCV